ncbi:MAG: DNRLRE domain-containing protein [Bacilli bacterium]
MLHRSDVATSFSFLVNTAHVFVRDDAQKGLVFYDEQTRQPVALIPNPVVTDAHGAVSRTAATLQVVPDHTGRLTVTIRLNPKWLQASGRAFPVTIDPSIVQVTGPALPHSINTLGKVDYGSLAIPIPSSAAGPQEVLALRTNRSQTFVNPNSTFTTKLFPTQQFYRDATGAWQTINNTLTPSGNSAFAYQNTANAFQTLFASTPKSDGMVKWSESGHSIAFGVTGASPSTATVSGNEVTYPNAFPNTDVQYQVLADRLKESILLHNASAPTSYSFALDTSGLTYKQQPSGAIVFSDAKTGVFVAQIPAPVMYDATAATSTAVLQTITDNGLGTATLTLTANASWIQDPARQFPITIDPTVTSNGTAFQDTFVSQTYPTTNYSGSTYATDSVGYSSYYGLSTSLFGFGELPPLPPGANGATIQSATLEAYQTNANEGGAAIQAVPITSSWNYGLATWNAQPSYGSVMDTQTQASQPASTSNAYVGAWSFNVTPIVKQWYGEQADNYGIALTTSTSAAKYATFASENNTSNPAPYLSITYTVQPVGQEPFWTQTADGVNVAGGNLEIQQTDLSTPGRGLPVSITRTFNSLNAASEPPGHTNLFGSGWTSSLDLSIANWGHGPIVFTDAGGLQHFFVPNFNNGGPNQYITTGAEHMTLSITSSGYTVTEQDGTLINFNTARRLTSIQAPTPSGGYQTTSLLYNTSGQLVWIQDASGRTWTVTQNANGTVNTITDPAGRVMTYSYDASGNLTGATLAAEAGSTDTTAVQYGYTSGQLTSATDPSGNITTYAYVPGTEQIQTVSRTVTVSGAATTATNTYSYSTNPSGDPTTTVTDASGRQALYTLAPGGEVKGQQVDPSGLNLTTQYAWNQDDQLQSVTDPHGNTTSYAYDNSSLYSGGTGVPMTVTLPNGGVESYAVSAHGNVVSANSANGSQSHTTYANTIPGDSINTMGKTSLVNTNSYGQAVAGSAPMGLGQNLMPNGSFENVTSGLPTDWQDASGVGTVTDTASTAEIGSHAVEIQAGSSSPTYLLQNEYMPVHPNQTYVLTFWVKTSGVQGVSTSSGMIGAVVNAHWYSAPGTAASDPSPAPSSYLGNMLATNGWTRKTVMITAPDNANYLNFNLVLYGTTGTAYWDGLQLAPASGNGETSANALVNSSFANNYSGATLPDNWTIPSDVQGLDWIDTSTVHNGLPSVAFSGDGVNADTMSQTVTVPSWNWNGIVLSDWSKESGGTSSTSSTYDLTVTASYPATSTNPNPTQTWSINDGFVTGWQYGAYDLSKSQLMLSGVLPTKLTVTANYTDASGTAWFNDLQLRFLAASAPSTQNNLLENPDFANQYNGGSLPDYWFASGTGGASVSATPNVSSTGSTTYTISASSAATQSDTFTGEHALVVTAPSSGTAPETVSSGLPIPFDNRTFTLIGYVHTTGFSNGAAYLRIDALDASGSVIGSFDSPNVSGNAPWTRVDVVVPASLMPTGTASLQVTAAVNPDANGSGAAAYFDDLMLVPYNALSAIQYDSNSNNVTSASDALGNTVTYGYGNDNTGGGFSANFTGVNTGDPNQITDANGVNSYLGYNKQDQIVGYTYTDQNGGTTSYPTFNYTYDPNGNLTGIQDPTGHAVSYQYNQLNESAAQTETVSGAAQTTTQSYNAAGLLTGVSHPNGTTESFTYDNANRITGQTDTNGSTTDSFAMGYDKNSNLTGASENGGPAYTFTYDNMNQVTSDGQPFSSSITNTESFNYDLNGNPESLHYSLNNSTPETWSISDLYDLGSELIQAGDGRGTVQFTYNARGMIATVHDVEAKVTTYYTYNAVGEVSEVKAISNGNANNLGQVIEDYTYQYDGNRNVIGITNVLTGASLSYTYDSLNQLTRETTWSGNTLTYTYDKLGNRTSVTNAATGVTTTYTYDAEGNRLTSVGGTSLSYDGNGQMTAYGSNTYNWNIENQLASVTTANGTDTYTYDPLGHRATIDGYHIGYIGQSDLVSYVTDSSNNLVKRFTYNAAGLPVLMTVSYGGAWYTYGYVYDGTGQIVGLVDDTTGSSTLGQEVVTYTYDTWGNLLSDTDTSGIGAATINPFVYKGYWYDWSTGLYYLNARYYNPVIGRFLSEDPAGPSVGNNVPGYNGYAYAENNPVNRVDPSGTASYNVYLMARFGIKERATSPTIPGWIVWTGAQVALLVLTEGLAGPELLAADEGVAAAEGAGEILQVGSKSEALASVNDLPESIQSSAKSFFKGSSTKYTSYNITSEANGNYVISMVKPGDVPGSKAIYYKVLSPDGETISVYKDSFDPQGNIVHSKPKN